MVTDPPYEIGFLPGRQEWDTTGVAFDVGLWSEVLRTLKPGGHAAIFGGTRTFHRVAVAVEDAGFEIRDSLAWIYGSGMPKGRNLGRDLGEQWSGWSTALKPAFEPIILARKPTKSTIASTVREHSTGGLNIDACRIPARDPAYERNHSGDRGHGGTRGTSTSGATDLRTGGGHAHPAGRWPANVILDEHQAALLDMQTGVSTSGTGTVRRKVDRSVAMAGLQMDVGRAQVAYGDSRGASRFFYCANAPKSERPVGADGQEHSTVKPLSLMSWLIRLLTPPSGTILDPFLGSGTTAEAALLEGFRIVGVEREAAYLDLIGQRILRAAGTAPLVA